ncbi:hypothetical protein N8482_03410 [Chitinophagales bacterium]|nr:hypothetical protein [Chitinophagales bacterium]
MWKFIAVEAHFDPPLPLGAVSANVVRASDISEYEPILLCCEASNTASSIGNIALIDS